jgi:hypothetical protein
MQGHMVGNMEFPPHAIIVEHVLQNGGHITILTVTVQCSSTPDGSNMPETLLRDRGSEPQPPTLARPGFLSLETQPCLNDAVQLFNIDFF